MPPNAATIKTEEGDFENKYIFLITALAQPTCLENVSRLKLPVKNDPV